MMLELVYRAFIVFGIVHMFVNTDGPAGTFKRIKQLVGVNYADEFDGYGQKIGEVEESTNVVAKMLTCFYCLSFWLCLLWGLYSNRLYDASIVYGMSSFLYRITDRRLS